MGKTSVAEADSEVLVSASNPESELLLPTQERDLDDFGGLVISACLLCSATAAAVGRGEVGLPSSLALRSPVIPESVRALTTSVGVTVPLEEEESYRLCRWQL